MEYITTWGAIRSQRRNLLNRLIPIIIIIVIVVVVVVVVAVVVIVFPTAQASNIRLQYFPYYV
jgi:flagellar basal body-associated protein FliL